MLQGFALEARPDSIYKWFRFLTPYAAFWNDELFAEVMHPYREEYPDDFANYWRQKFRKAVDDPSHCVLVSTAQDDGRGEIITGYADWVRQSADGHDDSQTGTTDAGASENRAADPSKLDILDRASEFVKHYWSGNRAETWYLDILGIDPGYHRRGLGRLLTMEGIKLAEKDRVCASVISSLAGHPLYLSCGFKDVGWATEGEGNPLRVIPSGQIMFWESEATKQS
jgi:ribosomal protein S18 acetylase RimI-like enzyme